MKFEFIKDENNSKIIEFFENNKKLKEIHIDIYPENPLTYSSHSSHSSFMLLLRTTEKNVLVENYNDRFIIRKNDNFNTVIMNILLSNVVECFYEIVDDNFCEFIFKFQNIYYRITIIN